MNKPKEHHITKMGVLSLLGVMALVLLGITVTFSTLGRFGREEGPRILDIGANVHNPSARETQEETLAEVPKSQADGKVNGDVLGLRESTDGVTSNLTMKVSRAFSGQSLEHKKAVLRELRKNKDQLKRGGKEPILDSVLSVIKRQMVLEKSLAVRDEIILTVATLDRPESALSFLDGVVTDPKAPRYLKGHARYVREALELEVFR